MSKAKRDTAFLPAAESLIETPVSPLSRVLALTIALLFLIGLIWAFFARVDTVVTAQGRLVAEDRSKLVQSEVGGTVHSILIRNGDQVESGQPLIQLDDTISKTERASTLARLQSQQAEFAILDAILTDRSPQLPVTLPPSVKRDAQAKFAAVLSEHSASLAKFQAETGRQNASLLTLEARKTSLAANLSPVQDRLERARPLFEDNLLSRLEFEAIEAEARELENQLAILTAQKTELLNQQKAASSDRDVYLTSRTARFARQQSELLTSIQELQQRLLKLDRDAEISTLRAPVAGIVQELTAFTEGGIIAPGDVIMRIAPRVYELEGEAMVLNKDVGFIQPGMAVKVKLEAFPFTKYGFLTGELHALSLDAIEDPNLGLAYGSIITFDERTISVEGEDVPLTPGMTATFEVQTGSQRVIEFLISPLLRFRDEALRER